MQLALVGLPAAGVKTVFNAITSWADSAASQATSGGQNRIAVVKVPDPRLDRISRAFSPRKTTPATVELIESPGLFGDKIDARSLARVREADALVVVLRVFENLSVPHLDETIDPARDLDRVLSEMLLSDLAIVENRLERLTASLQKRKSDEELLERDILLRCLELLNQDQRLSELDLPATQEKVLRGFGFLTQKEMLILLNIGDNQIGQEEELAAGLGIDQEKCTLCADIEAELATLEAEEREEFMRELAIQELAAPQVLRAAYRLLKIVTFFTYGEDECRAWRVRQGQNAVDAAGQIHSDLARGFIRAEVVSFPDFDQLGGIKEAKAAGRFRLEGKDYPVVDGDIIIIRHSS